MKKQLLGMAAAAFIFFATGCTTDFDVTADWKQINIVYGLLEPYDSVQYIRITKAFLNENTSALDVAAIPDSSYHQDSLHVVLQPIQNGNVLGNIELYKTELQNKEPGDFSYPSHILYRTPPSFQLDPELRYRIVLESPATGNISTGETEVLGPVQPEYPRASFGADSGVIDFSTYSKFPLSFYTGQNAYFYDIILQVSYLEYPQGQPDQAVLKELDWYIDREIVVDPESQEEVLVRFESEGFFRFLGSNIEVDPGIRRRLRNVVLVYGGGTRDLYYYITLNRPSLNIVEKQPEYTNIENGLGLFASRQIDSLRIGFTAPTLDSIRAGIYTKPLNFQ